MDIHNFEHKIKRLWERVDEQCSDKNKKILKKFESELYANGLSNARIMIYIEPLLVISKRFKKNLIDLSKDDLKRLFPDSTISGSKILGLIQSFVVTKQNEF